MDLLAEVARLKEKAFEIAEFTPESDIQICEFMGEFATGVAFYQTLSKPSPEDDRWVGLCYIVLGEQERAIEHLMRSVERGCIEAKIDLARLYSDSRIEDSVREISEINIESLSRSNLALFYRNLSMINMKKNIKYALYLCEKSWRIIQNCGEFKFLAPRILVTLSTQYQISQNPERAEYYLSRAIEICISDYIWNIKMAQAYLLYDMNKFFQSEELCLEIFASEDVIMQVNSLILLGRIKLSEFLIDDACAYLEKAGSLSKSHRMFYDYFISQSYLCMIYKNRDQNFKYMQSINEMSRYVEDETLKWRLKLREVYVDLSNKSECLKKLDSIIEFRDKTHSTAESMRAMLHKANVLLMFGDMNEVNFLVDKIIDFCVKNSAEKCCSEEWVFLIELRNYIENIFPNFFPNTKKDIIEIISIDKEVIKIGSKIIKIPLKKTLELIIFIYLKERCKINEIVLNVFGESDKSKAKNYFHQIRYVLNNKIHSINIVYDKISMSYYIKSEFEIVCDIERVIKKKAKFEGVFLPSSESEWAYEVNAKYGL